MSPNGTKRTPSSPSFKSAFDPKRTSVSAPLFRNALEVWRAGRGREGPDDATVSTSPTFRSKRRGRWLLKISPSLYERLGGVYSIATVVDDLIDRIMVDPRLNANPKVDEAHHRFPPAGFKYLVTEMLCWAAGGPQKYTCRSMKDLHRDLMITAVEWDAFLDDLRQTLDNFAVPQAEQAEIKAIVDSTRGDIVV